MSDGIRGLEQCLLTAFQDSTAGFAAQGIAALLSAFPIILGNKAHLFSCACRSASWEGAVSC